MRKIKEILSKGFINPFTLIELIVVIVILGILAAIVVPNISSLKEDAIPVAVSNNERALQTALDMYGLDHNGQLPTAIPPTIEDPQPPDYSVLYPDYIRSKPEVGHYLIDVFGKVWGSTSIPPNQINYVDGEFSFKTVETASAYELLEYGQTEEVNANAGRAVGKYKINSFAKLPMEGAQAEDIYRVENPENKSLLVSAVDKFGLQAAPVGKEFLGVQDGLPITGTGTFYLITDANGKAVWDGLKTNEILPEGTSIEYSFATSENGKTYSEEFVNDMSFLENSRYLKVKVDMKSTNKNEPSLKYLKVIFHLLEQEEDEDVVIHTPVIPINLGSTEKEKNFTETIDLGSKKEIGTIEFVGKEKVNASYQSSEDGITYSPTTPYVEELPDGRYIKVTAEVERESLSHISPTVDKMVVNNSPKIQPNGETVTMPVDSGEPIGEPDGEWETINSMTIVEDATEIGDWVSIQTTEQEPSGTRMLYRLSTSDDEVNWSETHDYTSNINLIPEMNSSRYLKVEVIKQRNKGVSNSPSLNSITIDYSRNGSIISSSYGNEGVEIPNPPSEVGNSLIGESAIGNIPSGEHVQFGKHFDGTPITWNVIKEEDGKLMLFMTEPIKGIYGNYEVKEYGLRYNKWDSSPIRTWLNYDFYSNAFENEDKSIIADTTHDQIASGIHSEDSYMTVGYPAPRTVVTSGTIEHIYKENFDEALSNYDVAFKSTSTEKVFFLNIDELLNDVKPALGVNWINATDSYWLRDAQPENINNIRSVSGLQNGIIATHHGNNYNPVRYSRPAIFINSGSITSGDGTSTKPYVIK